VLSARDWSGDSERALPAYVLARYLACAVVGVVAYVHLAFADCRPPVGQPERLRVSEYIELWQRLCGE
jgi:hypothetical protein